MLVDSMSLNGIGPLSFRTQNKWLEVVFYYLAEPYMKKVVDGLAGPVSARQS